MRHPVATATITAACLLAMTGANAADRKVRIELRNNGDSPVLGVTLDRMNPFSGRALTGQELALATPIAPGQTRILTATVSTDSGAVPQAVRWRWTEQGSCSGGATLPDRGDSFTADTGQATCPGGKPLPHRRSESREVLMAEAQAADENTGLDLFAGLLARNPNDAAVLHARAHMRITWGDSEFGPEFSSEAIADLNRALTLVTSERDRLHLHNDAMFHLLNHDRWQPALPHLDALVAGHPDDPKFLAYRATAYCQLEQRTRAAQDEAALARLDNRPLPAELTCEGRRAAKRK